MNVRIIRSARRRKTVQAREVDGILEVRAPAAMPETELQPVIAKLQARLEKRHAGRQLDDAWLARRADLLNRRFFGGRLIWQSICWSARQTRSHGSCTPSQGTIRISQDLANLPRFVLDYVIVHELAHLLEANHGPRFWALVNRYPRTERARGYLMAVSRPRSAQPFGSP